MAPSYVVAEDGSLFLKLNPMSPFVHDVTLIFVVAVVVRGNHRVDDGDRRAQVVHDVRMVLGHVVVGCDKYPAVIQLAQSPEEFWI